MAKVDPTHQNAEARSLNSDHHHNISLPRPLPHHSGNSPPPALSLPTPSSPSIQAHYSPNNLGSPSSAAWSLDPPSLSASPSPPSEMSYNAPYFSSRNFTHPRTPSPSMSNSPPSSAYAHDARSITSESIGSSLSPAPSVYSLTDSLREASFKQVHGRLVNAHSDVYMLPADDEEVNRLETQHNIFRILNNGNYLGPVRETLAGWEKHVLDLGTGTGVWAVEMAMEFPNAQVVGVDLAPIQVGRTVPENCRFEVDDVNLDMSHFYNSFDVVHARHICAGITDYPALMGQITKILKPGGLVLFFEAEYYVFDGNKRPLGIRHFDDTNSRGERREIPSLAKFAAAFVGAVMRRGGKINVGARMPDYAKDTGKFSEIVYQDVWFPATPWMGGNSPEARRLRMVGHLIREDLRSFLQAGRPMLLTDGMTEASADELIQQSLRELDSADTPMWLRGCYTWARKLEEIAPDGAIEMEM